MADFYKTIRRGLEYHPAHREEINEMVLAQDSRDYDVRFTHGDFGLRHVFYDTKSKKVTGIIDWEFAGWFPDYWEYTMAGYPFWSYEALSKGAEDGAGTLEDVYFTII